MADHGGHIAVLDFPFLPDNARNVENVLPIFMNLVPKSIPRQNLEFLRANEQSFMTHHDFYSTMKTIATRKVSHSDYSESYSYVSQTLPTNRD